MKFLYLFLFSIITSSITMGGWKEVKNFQESNDIKIQQAIQKAKEGFLIRVNSMNPDAFDIRPLGLYTQLVNGVNYRVIFATNTNIPGRNDLRIHDYTYTLLPIQNNQNSMERMWSDEFANENDLDFDNVSLNSPKFSKIHSEISKYLMNRNSKLNYVSNIGSVNVNGVNYFGVYAKVNGKDDESSFVVVQNDDGTFTVLEEFN